MKPHTSPQAPSPNAQLPRVLNHWDAAALAVGIIIGSGIFAVPPSVAGRLNTFGAMILVWILGGVLALSGALTYAELSTMFPRTGGPFVFLHETYGPLASFTYGWSALLITYPASLAAIAMVFARYLSQLVSLSATGEAVVAAVLCLVLAGINGLGARVGAGVQRTLTAAKVAALAAIPLFGFLLAKGDFSRLTDGGVVPTGGWTLSGWAFAMAAVMWTFEGWADTPTIAGEVKDKKRDIPRGLVMAAVSTTLIYVAANAAYVYLLGVDGVAATNSVATDAASAVFGGGGALFVTLLVIISTAGSINGSLIGGSRVFFAMASEGLFLKSVARVHPRFGTPFNSLALLGVISAAYCLLGTFERLMSYFVFVATIWFALNILAVIILRVRRPDVARPFRVPLYPLTPLVFLGVILSLGVQLFLDNTSDALIGIGLICLAIPGYYIWKRSHRGLPS
jgi:APA family basic amino acid/polyamine antiporter